MDAGNPKYQEFIRVPEEAKVAVDRATMNRRILEAVAGAVSGVLRDGRGQAGVFMVGRDSTENSAVFTAKTSGRDDEFRITIERIG